jgi:hypothetical protein
VQSQAGCTGTRSGGQPPASGGIPTVGPGPKKRGLHPGEAILGGLDVRFTRRFYAEGPYFFADLAGASEAEEQGAIDAGQIQAGGIRYAATRP